MNIRIPKSLGLALGKTLLAEYGKDVDRYRYDDLLEIDGARYSSYKLLQLKNAIEAYPAHKGAQVAMKDLSIWLAALKDVSGAKMRDVKSFSALLIKYLSTVPRQHLYAHDDTRGVWYTYYVHKVVYTPAHVSRDYTDPAYCTMYLAYQEFGERQYKKVSFYLDHVRGCTVAEALHSHGGYMPEVPELRASYDGYLSAYEAWASAHGKQFWASGYATDDLDGNPKRNDSWYWRRTNTVRMDKNGDLGRVLIDVFKEDDTEERETHRHGSGDGFDPLWWSKARKATPDEDGDIVEGDDRDLEETEITMDPEVPVHPTVATFDLKKHLRLRLHIGQLTEYQYDRSLGEKLVLPQEDRDLVDILLAHNSTFADVIAGKGGGSVVLCTGAPGLGKTLTAEIYSEVAERPLYTVQCSQLGTEPDELEDNLLKCFARADRWRAILLLDEADVYIHPRGDDLTQNAIVGVFLRTLEYYRGVMFMTTNRPDLVDDAIASRCIARIDYALPSAEAQARIWAIQAEQNGAVIPPRMLTRIVAQNPACSGRDIKNLVKLALLVNEAKGKTDITDETIKFVRRFKPTGGE